MTEAMATMFLKMFIAVVSFVATAKATTNCEKDAILSPRGAQKCCKQPPPNWSAFARECSSDGKTISNSPSPCIIGCIFNVSEILQNGQLIKANACIMLSKLFSDNDFVDAYTKSFDICHPLIKRKMNERIESEKTAKRLRANIGQEKCSPIYLFFALCLHKYVFVNCPAHAWTSSTICDKTRTTICNQTEISVVRGYRNNSRKANKQRSGGFQAQQWPQ